MEHQRELAITLPLRADSLLERACPHCQARFAIHPEDYESGGYLNLRCPTCGWIAEKEDFTTPEQIAFVRAAGENAAREMGEELVGNQLKKMFSGVRSTSGVRVSGTGKRPSFGRNALPAANTDSPLTVVQCPACAFRYATPGTGTALCPVCR